MLGTAGVSYPTHARFLLGYEILSFTKHCHEYSAVYGKKGRYPNMFGNGLLMCFSMAATRRLFFSAPVIRTFCDGGVFVDTIPYFDTVGELLGAELGSHLGS